MMKCFGTLKDGEPVTKEALDMYDKLYKDKLPQKEFVAACEMFLSSRAAYVRGAESPPSSRW